MGRETGVLGLALTSVILLQSILVVSADTVINAEGIEIFSSGSFEEEDDWGISATSGFSGNPALYTAGMVADGELSFTHDRPDNFEVETSWAQSSITDSNSSTGLPDSFYTWSRGPNINIWAP